MADGSRAGRGDLAAWGRRLAAGENGTVFFPIRHHSPACALHLARALAEIRPRALVLEMPADFAPLLPLLADPAIRTPVSIVSIAAGKGDERVPIGHWPLSATAPEWAALRFIQANEVPVFLADLPSGTRLADEAATDEEAEPDAPEEPADAPAPMLLTDEAALAYGRYADNIVRALGARDFNEAWDRLFESRLAATDWRGFFRDVGVHCFLTRQATSETTIAADDTLAREAAMRAAIAEARDLAGDGPVAVVTGGFHTPALLDPPDAPEPRRHAAKPGAATPYLVRYTHQALDRINGYGAGMPAPAWYERLQAAAQAGAPDPFAAATDDLVLHLADRLRRERPGFAPPFPAVVETLAHARRLAALRGLPGPGRCEVLDAARSCLVKDEEPRLGSPLIELLVEELTGGAIGEVPRAAGSPPLVEAVRTRARALGFRIEDGIEKARSLDLHRRARHLAASRFLHAMTLLGTGFGQCRQGPDWTGGVSTNILTEQWTYRWSPAVETRLVALSADGDTIERAAGGVLARQVAALGEAGRDRDAAAAVRLLVGAAQAGLAGACGPLVRAIGAAVAADPDFGRVVSALAALDNLYRGRHVLGLADTPDPEHLRAGAFRRAIDLLPTLRDAREDDVPRLVEALAALNEIAETDAGTGTSTGERQGLDLDLLDEGVADLLDAALAPRVAGAIAGLAFLTGRLDAAKLAAIVGGPLDHGGDARIRVEPLAGLLAVQPAVLKRVPALLARVDAGLSRLSETEFLALLPPLRLAFTGLAPGETDSLAAAIAAGRNSDMDLSAPLPSGLAEADLLANARLDAALAARLRDDGLGAWLEAAS
ncbi:DUF5682 family protein [Antarcticirhabdus aurantiaca]|uniref:DUF5682 family protein n=1 Tax=Antarcticirhabdus aurantiaca TaxID=2606717 RepID=A0ACD4NU93_9HYPH|nr:DUF5682 family protein [Antarcticirhabdus aurantiaca]WAJ30348.1 DUF5682 family protein [Jeongeuplla avenae]